MVSNNVYWLTIILAGIGTILIRTSFMTFIGKRGAGGTFERLLKYIPSSILAAMVVPSVLLTPGTENIDISNPRIWAGLIAFAIAWRTKNILATIIIGLVSLWIINYLV